MIQSIENLIKISKNLDIKDSFHYYKDFNGRINFSKEYKLFYVSNIFVWHGISISSDKNGTFIIVIEKYI